MISLEDARIEALRVLVNAKVECELNQDQTIEREFGWVFFFDSKAFLHGGDRDAKLFGNAPLIVNRHTGKVSVTGTDLPVEDYIDAYEKLGAARYDNGEWREYLRGRQPPVDE